MTEVQFAKQFLTTLDSKPVKYQSNHAFDPKTFQTRVPYTLPKLSHPPHPLPPQRTLPTQQQAPPPGSEPATQPITLTLKSSRNPTFTLHLPSTPLGTPIATLRTQIQQLLPASVPAEKIKILYNKKPIPASKSTVGDVVSAEGDATVEFGVMVMGGAPDPSPTERTVRLYDEKVEAPGPGSENATVEAVTGVNPEVAMKDVGADVEIEFDEKTEVGVGEKRRRESQPVQPGEQSGKEVLGTSAFWDDLQAFLEQRLRSAEEAKRLRALFEKAAAVV